MKKIQLVLLLLIFNYNDVNCKNVNFFKNKIELKDSILKNRDKFLNKINNLNCNPLKGDSFVALYDFLDLKLEPNTNSPTIISPKKDNFHMTCVEDGVNNDYVKVELSLEYEEFEDKGVSKNTYNLLYNLLENKILLKNFFKLISNDLELRKVYNKLVKNKSLSDWDWDDQYLKKMKTFEGFKKYWIKVDKNKLDINYLLENQKRIVYVEKSDIKETPPKWHFTGGDNIDNYSKEVNRLISLKENNNCGYDEDVLFGNFSEYIRIITIKDPFLAIQKINLYSNYFESKRNIICIEYLKLNAVYEDKNYEATIKIAKLIINDFNQNNPPGMTIDGKIEIYRFIKMEMVYGMLISSYINLNNFSEAYNFSNKCIKDEGIQFDQFLEFHTIILKQLSMSDEMCDFLNKEYLKGNKKARALKIENCN